MPGNVPGHGKTGILRNSGQEKGIEWEALNSVALEPMLDPQFLVFSGILRDRCLELGMIFFPKNPAPGGFFPLELPGMGG